MELKQTDTIGAAMTSSPVTKVADTPFSPKERRTVILAAGLGWGLEFFDLMLVSLLATQIATHFNVTLAEIGVVFTAQLIATAAGGIVFGNLADRYGRKRVLTWTIWVFGLATVACALAPTFTVFLLLRIICGFGVGGEWAVGFSLLNEAWKPARRGLAGGIVQAAIWPAYALAIFVTGSVSDWRWAFVIGGFPVLAAIWIRRRCPESKQWLALQHSDTIPQNETKRSGSLPALFSGPMAKLVLLGTLVVFGAQYSYYVYSSWMPTYLKSDLGVSDSTAQRVLYISAVVALVSYVAAGALSDLWGRRRTLWAFAAVQFIGFIAFAALNFTDGSITLLIAAYYVISFGLGYFAIFGVWFGELFPTPVRATASSFCYSVGRGIASFGPLIVGYLAADYGLGGGISSGLLAVILMSGFAVLLRDRTGRAITATD